MNWVKSFICPSPIETSEVDFYYTIFLQDDGRRVGRKLTTLSLVEVGTEWEYLYRTVDSAGCTIEFMLSAKRDVPAAKRFFKRLMRVDQRRLPFTIGTDKHASYPLESINLCRDYNVAVPHILEAAGQSDE
ncbi:MAG: DDE-type integrase/transposase/recombinase [Pyrinomonadaceae bacterium]